jgi:hypothetical protein
MRSGKALLVLAILLGGLGTPALAAIPPKPDYVVQDLGLKNGAYSETHATSMGDGFVGLADEVVGWANGSGGRRIWIWRKSNGQMVDLNFQESTGYQPAIYDDYHPFYFAVLVQLLLWICFSRLRLLWCSLS